MAHQLYATFICLWYLLLDSTLKIQNATSTMYSRLGNDAQVCEQQKKVCETKQRDMFVAQYFAESSSLWRELYFYQDFQANCPSDAVKFQKLIDKERVYDFLVVLNIEYDYIRVQVLGRKYFPSLRQTYSHVQQEKSRKNALLHLVTHERLVMIDNFNKKKNFSEGFTLLVNQCQQTKNN